METNVITKRAAQRNLTIIWAGFTLFLSIIFFVQTIVSDKYSGQNDEVWDWFIPLAFPTLALMISVLVAVAQSPDAGQTGVDKFFYWLTLVIIVVYFLLLLSVVLSAPLDFIDNQTPALDHLKKATKLITGMQVVVTSVLGFFFFKENK